LRIYARGYKPESIPVADLTHLLYGLFPPLRSHETATWTCLLVCPGIRQSDFAVFFDDGKSCMIRRNKSDFTNWGIYARGYKPESIPVADLTHLLYGLFPPLRSTETRPFGRGTLAIAGAVGRVNGVSRKRSKTSEQSQSPT
jgi:GH18 family chitinase